MRKFSGTIAAAIFIACPTALAWAQSPSAQAPGVQLQHSLLPGSAPIAPAMSLLDLPPHPAEAAGLVPRLTHLSAAGTFAHMMPTVEVAAARAKAGIGGLACPGTTCNNLVYHANGQIMYPSVQVYNIYWQPATLQNGAATTFAAGYGLVTLKIGAWMMTHGLTSVATQYFQTISSVTSYFQNAGGLQSFVVDTGAYPASGCTDTGVPTSSNCINDGQLQTKIAAVMNANGWTGGINKIFVMFTSSDEGSCFTSASASCAYTQYCAYHSSFTLAGQPVIYANIPYGNPSGCQTGGQTTPNQLNGDLAASVTTHEINEAATDPFGNAWWDSASGNENGDNCNFTFGTNTWGTGAGAGNQMWNGTIFEVQEEWSNHTGPGATGCVQAQ
jgi:hypothetical protein